MLAPENRFLVYDLEAPFGRADDCGPSEAEHASASLVFESVMIEYLRTALRQQCALFDGLLGGGNGVLYLRAALGNVKCIITQLLPLHFETRVGNESILLAAHFYHHFVARLLRAQICHALALGNHMVAAKQTDLTVDERCARFATSAALFAEAFTVLESASHTQYCNTDMIAALAQQRRASALITLAMAFQTAEKEAAARNFLVYAGQKPPDASLAAAIEAYHCSRAACALTAGVHVIKELFLEAGTRGRTIYELILPPAALDDPPAAVVADVLRSGGATRVPDWSNEFDQIEIKGYFGSSQCVVTAEHACPRGRVVSVGTGRRRYAIWCEIKI